VFGSLGSKATSLKKFGTLFCWSICLLYGGYWLLWIYVG
jgi:hypothetical protein